MNMKDYDIYEGMNKELAQAQQHKSVSVLRALCQGLHYESTNFAKHKHEDMFRSLILCKGKIGNIARNQENH